MLQWLTVDEVAQHLKFTPQHIRRLCEKQEIPSRRFGREWRIPVKGLDLLGEELLNLFSNAEPKELESENKEALPTRVVRPRGRPRLSSVS